MLLFMSFFFSFILVFFYYSDLVNLQELSLAETRYDYEVGSSFTKYNVNQNMCSLTFTQHQNAVKKNIIYNNTNLPKLGCSELNF